MSKSKQSRAGTSLPIEPGHPETNPETFNALNAELTAINRELRDKVAELQAVNNDLHNLLGSAVIATIFLDTSFRIRRFTPAARTLFNLTPADIGRRLDETPLHDIGDSTLNDDVLTVLRNPAPVEKEVYDGRERYYLRRVTPYRTGDNRIEGAVLAYTDISRMKRTEEQLRVRERQQAAVAEIGWKALSGSPLQELLDMAVARVAEVCGVQYVKLLELQPGSHLLLRAGIGWREGLVGKATVPAGLGSQSGFALTTREPVIVEDMQRERRFTPARLLLDHGISSGISVIIGTVERPYGVLGIHSSKSRHFTPDDIHFLQSVAHVLWEAIERHRREEMLHLSEARLRLAMEFGRIGCWQWDIKSNILYWDKSLFHMLGLPEESFVNLESFYERVHPEDVAQLRAYIAEVVESRSDYESEFRVIRADNDEVRWLGAKGGLLFNEQGEPFAMFGVNYDVTGEKNLKMELEAARQAAEAASQVKSEFLANMSHEIRSPLTAVLGYSDLILVESDWRKVADFAAKIKQNGQYLLEIVDDVLDLSRAEANKLTLRKERFSPQRLLADLCSVMRMRARDKGIEMSVKAEGDIPETIEGDPTRLRQILLNLIGNAVKFTSQGQITVTMRLENSDMDEPVMAFEVSDTGIGIAPEDLERMFEPFEQAETSSSRRYQGAGLGLTISKHLTEILGGTISVHSELGCGSVFSVRVPTGSLHDVKYVSLDPNLLATVHTTRPETQHQLNARILIVDDIEDVRVLLEQILCGAGARVRTAVDAEQALQFVAQAEESGDAFDLILMDIMLPGMDGAEAVKRLRDKGFRRPIVALTAAARESDRQRCLQAGCNDYFCKPIDDEHLLAMVDNYTQGVKSLTQPAAGGEVQSGEPVKILIVEDNHDAGTALCKLLEAAGYISRYAEDAAAALRVAQEFMPHVVLLDLTLPDRDGTEVLQILKSRPGFENTLFIALSGRFQPDEGEQLIDQGFDHFLLKPASLGNLKTLLPPVPAEHARN